MKARGNHCRGYTLVELVVVMTVAGALAATMGPKFFTQTTFTDRGYADELAAALRAAQKAAVITGCSSRLTLTATTDVAAQQAASGNACNSTDTTWTTPVLDPVGVTVAGNASGTTTASPVGTYYFDDQGRLSSSPATTITVGTHTITIVAGTGLVQVQ